jgi:hypothetical protein
MRVNMSLSVSTKERKRLLNNIAAGKTVGYTLVLKPGAAATLETSPVPLAV